jgi:hypothetical protein
MTSSLPDRPIGAEPDLAQLLAQTTESRVTARAFNQLAVALAASARAAGGAAFASGRWAAGVVVDAAPHIPVRDLATLREHHGGLTGEELAEAMVRQAMLATSGVGLAGGAVTAVQWTVPVTMVAIPFQLVVEAAAVAAIEIKLVAELHEVYGVPVAGTPSQRGAAYAMSWAGRRGINPLDPASLSTALGVVARSRVQRRLVIRAGRGIGTMAPLMAGAAYGAVTNRRTTRSLSDALRADLRRRRPLSGGIGGLAVGRLISALPSGEPSLRSRRRPWARPRAASSHWPDD